MKLVLNISPPKCGTTSLYKALVKSSSIAESAIKEPRFFMGDESSRFIGLPKALEFSGSYHFGLKWFDDLFNDPDQAKYHIDFTTYYAISNTALPNAKNHYDTIKAILILRDPIDRFLSHYWQYRKMGIAMPELEIMLKEQGPEFELLLAFSRYTVIYNYYSTNLGQENILLLKFSALRDKQELEIKVNAFLEIEDFVYQPSEQDKNKAGLPKYGFLQKIIFSSFLKNLLNILIPKNLKVSLLKIRKKIILMNIKETQYEKLSENAHKKLETELATEIDFYNSID